MGIHSEVIRIPHPFEILKGRWGGIVYAICTRGCLLKKHEEIVNAEVNKLMTKFDNENHHSISLREEKRELSFTNANDYPMKNYESIIEFCTLVQFRVRNMY